jgi:hypothetical protein
MREHHTQKISLDGRSRAHRPAFRCTTIADATIAQSNVLLVVVGCRRR